MPSEHAPADLNAFDLIEQGEGENRLVTANFDKHNEYLSVSLHKSMNDTTPAKVNVFNTHAETMWWAAAQKNDNTTYPEEKDEKTKRVKINRISTNMVPPDPPVRDGQASLTGHQGPVYRILEEESVEEDMLDEQGHPIGGKRQVHLGYISEGRLEAMNYLMELNDDVGQAPHGELFKDLLTTKEDAARYDLLTQQDKNDMCGDADKKIIHIMNRRGVAQCLGTGYLGASKMVSNFKKYQEDVATGAFGCQKKEADERVVYTFEFSGSEPGMEDGGAYRFKGTEETDIDQLGPLRAMGIDFNADGSVKKVHGQSPAYVVGISDDLPFVNLVQKMCLGADGQVSVDGVADGYKQEARRAAEEFQRSTMFEEIRVAPDKATKDKSQTMWQPTPFSVDSLKAIILEKKAHGIALMRAPLADEDLVYKMIECRADWERRRAHSKIATTAQKEGWFVHPEMRHVKAWPIGESDSDPLCERAHPGPFPADWPGYQMNNEAGEVVPWRMAGVNPAEQEAPADEESYGREFIKEYCYVKARGSKKGPSGKSGDKWMGMTGLYAALYGYETQGKKGEELEELFPDRNAEQRRAYRQGLQAQIPKQWTRAFATKSPPEVTAERHFKSKLLRAAYFQGFNNPNKKAEELTPGSREMREAYKAGKRAVCIGIQKGDWDSWGGAGKVDLFKKLAVPVEYQFLGREGEDDRLAKASMNWFLRLVWKKAVDEAWVDRTQQELTKTSASARVPDETKDDKSWVPLRDAFKVGSDARKRFDEYCAATDGVCAINVKATDQYEMKTHDDVTNTLDSLEGGGGVWLGGGGDDQGKEGIAITGDNQHIKDELVAKPVSYGDAKKKGKGFRIDMGGKVGTITDIGDAAITVKWDADKSKDDGADAKLDPKAAKAAKEAKEAKLIQEVTPGQWNGVKEALDMAAVFQASAVKFAFIDGVKAQWDSYGDDSGDGPPKPDQKYPYTLEDLKKAYEDGINTRTVDEKKKMVAAVEKEPEEEGLCAEIIHTCCFPCIMFANSCFPICTKDDAGKGICCGTYYGDVLIILCCFTFWYTFLGMWYWTLIEIMFCIAEPQRPW